MPTVSVVMPAFNAASTIAEALEALAKQDLDAAYEVIVVDDGSTDETTDIVAAAELPVRLITQANEGPAAARNRGAQEAEGEILAFTDADCRPRPDWLRRGIACLAEADLVQGCVVADPRVPPEPFDRTIWVLHEHGLYETANLLVTRELFGRIGGFEDWLPARIGKPLAEDVWFGWKAQREGARIKFCSEAMVEHWVFRRSAPEYIAERLRVVYFPDMVAKVPELREGFLFRRWFLTRRTFTFDLAVVGALLSSAAWRSGHPAELRLAPLLLAGPYLRRLVGDALPWRRRAAKALAAEAIADAVTFAALAWGSLRRRTPVL